MDRMDCPPQSRGHRSGCNLQRDDSITAALYGPLVLAANLGPGPSDGPDRLIYGGATVPKGLPAASPLPKVAAASGANTQQWIQIDSASELRFIATGEDAKYQLMPIYQIAVQRYSVYCRTQSQKKKLSVRQQIQKSTAFLKRVSNQSKLIPEAFSPANLLLVSSGFVSRGVNEISTARIR